MLNGLMELKESEQVRGLLFLFKACGVLDTYGERFGGLYYQVDQ